VCGPKSSPSAKLQLSCGSSRAATSGSNRNRSRSTRERRRRWRRWCDGASRRLAAAGISASWTRRGSDHERPEVVRLVSGPHSLVRNHPRRSWPERSPSLTRRAPAERDATRPNSRHSSGAAGHSTGAAGHFLSESLPRRARSRSRNRALACTITRTACSLQRAPRAPSPTNSSASCAPATSGAAGRQS
jgi:hypothetical protein